MMKKLFMLATEGESWERKRRWNDGGEEEAREEGIHMQGKRRAGNTWGKKLSEVGPHPHRTPSSSIRSRESLLRESPFCTWWIGPRWTDASERQPLCGCRVGFEPCRGGGFRGAVRCAGKLDRILPEYAGAVELDIRDLTHSECSGYWNYLNAHDRTNNKFWYQNLDFFIPSWGGVWSTCRSSTAPRVDLPEG